MNGGLNRIFIERITNVLEDAKGEDFSKCPVGKTMPEGVVILLELRREELKATGNGFVKFLKGVVAIFK